VAVLSWLGVAYVFDVLAAVVAVAVAAALPHFEQFLEVRRGDV